MRFFLFLVTLFHFLLNHKILVYTILKSVEVSDPNKCQVQRTDISVLASILLYCQKHFGPKMQTDTVFSQDKHPNITTVWLMAFSLLTPLSPKKERIELNRFFFPLITINNYFPPPHKKKLVYFTNSNIQDKVFIKLLRNHLVSSGLPRLRIKRSCTYIYSGQTF